MFGIFSNKKKLLAKDIEFLNSVITSLPSKYEYLKQQTNDEFILGKKSNPLGDSDTYTLSLNADLENKYSNKYLPRYFILKNIKIANKMNMSVINIELDILEGMLAGYRAPTDYNNLDLNNIDTTCVYEKHFVDDERNELMCILGQIDSATEAALDLQETFLIELDTGSYYVIKNLGDGNYLSVNEQGNVYEMIHDPYSIDLLYTDLHIFYKDLKLSNIDCLK